MIPKHVKQEAARYKTLDQIEDKIADCVQSAILHYDIALLWVCLDIKREKLLGQKTVIKAGE